jgi:hypothetical protein
MAASAVPVLPAPLPRRSPLAGVAAAAAPSPSSSGARAHANANATSEEGRTILLLDVMDTLVADPFYEAMPRHFDLPFKELLAAKHPTAWVEFEKGEISESDLLRKFFKDGRPVDGAALTGMMKSHYRLLDGIEPLLDRLKAAGAASGGGAMNGGGSSSAEEGRPETGSGGGKSGSGNSSNGGGDSGSGNSSRSGSKRIEMHACSNYPVWWRNVEESVRLSRWLEWTFVSCEGPMRVSLCSLFLLLAFGFSSSSPSPSFFLQRARRSPTCLSFFLTLFLTASTTSHQTHSN